VADDRFEVVLPHQDLPLGAAPNGRDQTMVAGVFVLQLDVIGDGGDVLAVLNTV
jgi:hypothetical protein